MTSLMLKAVKAGMASLGLNYDFMRWNKEPVKLYFVGEYQESPSNNESGEQEAVFILNGWTRGSWADLEAAKVEVETYFDREDGKTVIAEDGTAVTIFYENSLAVPTGDAELQKMEIHLLVKEWKVT